ncbi:MAG: tyrosine-type recombinase/integrase [Lachnospiraceae bacterium]|nr:tyrosine-type recombinase/integrase [Lachnospiraceae bacterium]
MPAYALELQILIGARRGEIPPLRRSDVRDKYINISREQITVKKCGDAKTFYRIVEHTKTYRDRVFPRSDLLNEYLGRLYAILDAYYPASQFLFPADTDNEVIHNNTIYRLYERICRKLGIQICRDEIKGTHSFRRNAITDVVNASGGNVVLAARLFGNSPEVATRNYYTGIDTGEALKALNKRKLS